MAQRANARVAYYNGEYMPEHEVRVPFRDRSFKYGDAVFDMTRTFNGKAFRLREHIERFYDSLRYVQIDPGLSPDEMIAVSEEVLARNLHLMNEGEDFWLGQRVTRGVDPVEGDPVEREGPTVIVECTPLPLRGRARLFRDGIDVVLPSIRRVPPDSLSPRAKTHNYLNVIMADMEARAHNPDAWAVLLDVNGNLAEGMGSNIFVVRHGELYTPRERYVLAGISRRTAIELARELGIPVHQTDIDPFDARTADEAFLTSTSLCICPVRSVNGAPIGDGKIPGPITRRLTEAYKELVKCDFVGQYLRQLKGAAAA